ncbi:class I SAM-dependent methyltransferase [Haladaptatus sp. DYSN1]|uniref:class I SAM-dependent methyltransferase n=1 Tax=unclassified Haladaptatus TaxID=2622732 RepID=UPI002405CF9B|nr:class I SAM-dependent methyltransferase [Haladaptatus sp. DYSN1]
MPPRDASELFESTARYYARHRPRYDERAIEQLVTNFDLDEPSRVLDLGCGPGHLAIPLAAHAGEVVGMDPNEEMLCEARRLADEAGADNVHWVVGSDATIDASLGTFDLTVMGRSFHWMDRDRTLTTLSDLTNPGGGVAVLTDGDWMALPEAEWQRSVASFAAEFRAVPDSTDGTDDPARLHQDVLAESAFESLEIEHLEFDHEWTPDGIVGYVFSLSYCSPAVLGDAATELERAIREQLAHFDRETFTQHVEVTTITARKG